MNKDEFENAVDRVRNPLFTSFSKFRSDSWDNERKKYSRISLLFLTKHAMCWLKTCFLLIYQWIWFVFGLVYFQIGSVFRLSFFADW